MPLFKRLFFAFASLIFANSAMASSYTADFSGVSDPGGTGASFNYSVGDIDITVSGWSDTEDSATSSSIEAANMQRYGSGWGIVNQYESTNDVPGHSADNIPDGGWTDYDMFLLQFNVGVTLTGADFSWLYRSNSSQISASAISQSTAQNLSGSTWESVVADAGTLWSGSSNVDSVSYEASVNAGQTVSSYWLIGAYNSAFGQVSGGTFGDDGMKLSSISFTKQPAGKNEIPEPHSAILLLLGLAGVGLRRRRIPV